MGQYTRGWGRVNYLIASSGVTSNAGTSRNSVTNQSTQTGQWHQLAQIQKQSQLEIQTQIQIQIQTQKRTINQCRKQKHEGATCNLVTIQSDLINGIKKYKIRSNQR